MTTEVKLLATTVKTPADRADFEQRLTQHVNAGWTIVQCTITPIYRHEAGKYQDRYNVMLQRDVQPQPSAAPAPKRIVARAVTTPPKLDQMCADWLVTYHAQLRALDARIADLNREMDAADTLEAQS